MFQVRDVQSMASTLSLLYWILAGITGGYVLLMLVLLGIWGELQFTLHQAPISTSIFAVLMTGFFGATMYFYHQCRTYKWELDEYILEQQPRAQEQHIALYQILMAHVAGYIGILFISVLGSMAAMWLGLLNSLVLTVGFYAVGFWWFYPDASEIKDHYGKLKIEMKKPNF